LFKQKYFSKGVLRMACPIGIPSGLLCHATKESFGHLYGGFLKRQEEIHAAGKTKEIPLIIFFDSFNKKSIFTHRDDSILNCCNKWNISNANKI
jgi:hypothetical protein